MCMKEYRPLLADSIIAFSSSVHTHLNHFILIGKIALGKYGTSFIQKHRFIGIAGTVVTKQQPAGMGITGNGSSLGSRAVIIGFGQLQIVLAVGALVVKQVNTRQHFM